MIAVLHGEVKYLKRQIRVLLLGNKTRVLRDLSGPCQLHKRGGSIVSKIPPH